MDQSVDEHEHVCVYVSAPISCRASQRTINASVKPLASRGGMRTSSRQSFKNTHWIVGLCIWEVALRD